MTVPVFNTVTVGTDPTPDFGAAKKIKSNRATN